MTRPKSTAADTIAVGISRMDPSLAANVVFAGLSNDPNKIYDAFTLACDISAFFVLKAGYEQSSSEEDKIEILKSIKDKGFIL